jgi:hypothetical protein
VRAVGVNVKPETCLTLIMETYHFHPRSAQLAAFQRDRAVRLRRRRDREISTFGTFF